MIEAIKLDIKKEMMRIRSYAPEIMIADITAEEFINSDAPVEEVAKPWLCVQFYDLQGEPKYALIEKFHGREILDELVGIAKADLAARERAVQQKGYVDGLHQGTHNGARDFAKIYQQSSIWSRLFYAFNPKKIYEEA